MKERRLMDTFHAEEGYGDYTLAAMKDGKLPPTRMMNAQQTQDFCRRLEDQDERRSYKRSRVDGLVQGNPPFRTSKLRDANRSDATNVNWGTGQDLPGIRVRSVLRPVQRSAWQDWNPDLLRRHRRGTAKVLAYHVRGDRPDAQ